MSGLLEGLLPPGALIGEQDPREADLAALWPEERAQILGAVPRRQREYAAGRALARALLARLGAKQGPLLAGPDRAPIWPAGFVGSIAHCEGLVVVAVAERRTARSLGLDVEPALPLPEGVAEIVVGRDDRPWEGLGPAADRLIFCAKEAVYKALYPLTGTFMEHEDLAVACDGEGFEAVLTRDVGGFRRGEGFVGRWRSRGGVLGVGVALE